MLSFVVLCWDHKARVEASSSVVCTMMVAMAVAVLVLLLLLLFAIERRDSLLCQHRKDHAHLSHRYRDPRDNSTGQDNSARSVLCINVPVPAFLGR